MKFSKQKLQSYSIFFPSLIILHAISVSVDFMAEVIHVYKTKGSSDKQTDGQAASEGRHNEIPWKGEEWGGRAK